jgi:uncharacterized protein (TIGR02594 family)
VISWKTSGLPEPLWVEKLDKLSGIPEVVAGKLNPQITEMFRTTHFPIDKLTAKTAWCAAAVCWALAQAGYRSTRSAEAKSFIKYGIEVPVQYGSIVVFNPHSADAGGTGHIGFVVGVDQTDLLCLSGNSSNTVRRKWYPRSLLVASRWPGPEDALAPSDASPQR